MQTFVSVTFYMVTNNKTQTRFLFCRTKMELSVFCVCFWDATALSLTLRVLYEATEYFGIVSVFINTPTVHTGLYEYLYRHTGMNTCLHWSVSCMNTYWYSYRSVSIDRYVCRETDTNRYAPIVHPGLCWKVQNRPLDSLYE